MQFRLSTLLLLFVVLWTSLTLFGGVPGTIVTIAVVALTIAVARASAMQWALLGLLLLIVVVPYQLPSLRHPIAAVHYTKCKDNLRQIGTALQQYHDAYHCFPPAYIADKNGRLMHSWRVLILPHLGCDSLYKQYDFNEPWDGPSNKILLAARPKVYACPSDEAVNAQGASQTSYVVVVGSNAAWRGDREMTSRDFHGQSYRTVMVVETADADIQWTEPRDFSLDLFENPESRASAATVSSKHCHDLSTPFYTLRIPFAVLVSLADGSARRLEPDCLTPDRLTNGLKIGGCENLFDEANLPTNAPITRMKVKLGNCLTFPIWLLCVGVLLFRAARTRWNLGEQRAGEGTTDAKRGAADSSL